MTAEIQGAFCFEGTCAREFCTSCGPLSTLWAGRNFKKKRASRPVIETNKTLAFAASTGSKEPHPLILQLCERFQMRRPVSDPVPPSL